MGIPEARAILMEMVRELEDPEISVSRRSLADAIRQCVRRHMHRRKPAFPKGRVKSDRMTDEIAQWCRTTKALNPALTNADLVILIKQEWGATVNTGRVSEALQGLR